MAEIRACGSWIVITCRERFAVIHDSNTSTWQTFELPEPVPTKGESSPKVEGRNRILASAFSRDGRYFAVCDDRKQLHVYSAGSSWALLASRPLVRRSSCVRFLWDCQAVLVGDKSGDIYRFPLTEGGLGPGTLLLGHLSMLLDLAVTKDDANIVTADRDEKVRISHYPNAYNISQYCMGHTQFVKCLEYAADIDVIFSGSGDGCVRAWRSRGGSGCLACLSCAQGTTSAPPPGAEGSGAPRLAVLQLLYLPDQRLLLASLHGLSTVEVSAVEGEDQGEINLQPLQSLPCPSPPSLAVLPQGHLLALHPRDESPLTVFRLQDRKFHEVSAEDAALSALQNFVNGQREFFKEAQATPDDIGSLWKVPMDTTAKYLQEKDRKMNTKRGRKSQFGQQEGKKTKR